MRLISEGWENPEQLHLVLSGRPDTRGHPDLYGSARVAQAGWGATQPGEGSYGTCLDCEEEISGKRLEAVPWATLCLA
jgi:hypothetical protein